MQVGEVRCMRGIVRVAVSCAPAAPCPPAARAQLLSGAAAPRRPKYSVLFFPPAGAALAFCAIFKLGRRDVLLGPAARVLPAALRLLGSPAAAGNALARWAGPGTAA